MKVNRFDACLAFLTWLGVAIFACHAHGDAPATVRGTVFLDANGNGVRDAGEKGLSGVRITDGIGFVTTGADGAYTIQITADSTLPAPGTQGVAVCWPKGTWPAGKRWFRLNDMPDLGKVDFALRQVEQKLPFLYLHVTDSHDWRASPYPHQHEVTNSVLKEAKFIVHTGDVSLGVPQHCEDILQWQGKCSMPTLAAVGNHDTDIDHGKDQELTRHGTFVKYLGPLRFSFEYAGIHFAFADVIEDRKESNDFTAAWLEKDFAALKPGTRVVLCYHYPNPQGSERFLKVLRDYRVEMVHAGHNHAYGRWRDFAAPMVTAFARSSGSANLAFVDERGIHVGFFCDGCARGSHNYQHSRRCPTAWRDHVLEASIRGRYGELHSMDNVKLVGDGAARAVSTDAAYIHAEIAPGTAKTVGVRVGSGPTRLEVSFAAGHLLVNGAAYPFVLREGDPLLKLHIFAHKDLLTVWANESFFAQTPVKFQQAAQVRLFAAGGEATVRKLAIQEVKPDPANRARRYTCSCAHGAILRNPE